MSLRLNCNWSSCGNLRFQKQEAFAQHQQAHCDDLIQAAQASKRLSFICGWESCKLHKNAREFKTMGALRKHLQQHVKNHWCSHATCSISFSRRSDLKRHMETKHSTNRPFFCSFDACDRSADGFARKDKLDDHLKKTHPMFQCSFDHCESKVLESEMHFHLNEMHSGKTIELQREGMYECNLSGCESSLSRFNALSAKKHLIRHHGVSDGGAWWAVNNAPKSGPHDTRGGSFILWSGARMSNRPCPCCARDKTSTKAAIDHRTRANDDIDDEDADLGA